MAVKCPKCNHQFSEAWGKIRSTPENRYYWGVVLAILSEELGYSKGEAHEIMRSMFLKTIKHIRTKDKIQEVIVSQSTTTLTTTEFEDYLSQIKQFAAMQLGILIPDPNE